MVVMMMTMVLVISNCDGQYVYDDDGDDDDDLKVVVVVVATVRGEGFALLLVLLLLRGFSVVGCFTVACWEKIYLSMLFLLFLANTAAYMDSVHCPLDTRLKRESKVRTHCFCHLWLKLLRLLASWVLLAILRRDLEQN